jgi:hypothetical protein
MAELTLGASESPEPATTSPPPSSPVGSDPSTGAAKPSASPPHKVFSCNFYMHKFFSSQALRFCNP